jgi:hypothetical protein
MKKKTEKIGKKLNRNEMKKLAGGHRLNCEPNGGYYMNSGFPCCSGCYDAHFMCRTCEVPIEV